MVAGACLCTFNQSILFQCTCLGWFGEHGACGPGSQSGLFRLRALSHWCTFVVLKCTFPVGQKHMLNYLPFKWDVSHCCVVVWKVLHAASLVLLYSLNRGDSSLVIDALPGGSQIKPHGFVSEEQILKSIFRVSSFYSCELQEGV